MSDLFVALKAGDEETVRRALAEDPACARGRDADGVSAVLFACYEHRPDLAELVAEAAGGLDMAEAAALGRTERLRELLDAEPGRAYERSQDGFTALHLAASFGHRDAVALLLDRGADKGAIARNRLGGQPLHAACAGRHAPVVALLLARGADPNVRQPGGFTPLMSSAQAGDSESVMLLLRAGADPSAASDDGRSALQLARESRRAELIVPVIEAALAKRR